MNARQVISAKTYVFEQGCYRRGRRLLSLDEILRSTISGDIIEGAIELQIDGVYLLDKELWDLITILWWYLIGACEQLVDNVANEVWLPDRSRVCLSFAPKGEWTQVRLSGPPEFPELQRAIGCYTMPLVRCLTNEGIRFVNTMLRVTPGHLHDSFNDDLQRLMRLRTRIS